MSVTFESSYYSMIVATRIAVSWGASRLGNAEIVSIPPAPRSKSRWRRVLRMEAGATTTMASWRPVAVTWSVKIKSEVHQHPAVSSRSKGSFFYHMERPASSIKTVLSSVP
jgi:hypothetical protein